MSKKRNINASLDSGAGGGGVMETAAKLSWYILSSNQINTNWGSLLVSAVCKSING